MEPESINRSSKPGQLRRSHTFAVAAFCLACTFGFSSAVSASQHSLFRFVPGATAKNAGASPAVDSDRRTSSAARHRAGESDPVAEIESLEADCFDEVNRIRQARGLGELEFSRDLLAIAREHSRRMAEDGFFSHLDPQGRTVKERVTSAGVSWRALGENLAYSNGYINPVAAAIHGWMQSPGHRRNIVSSDYRRGAVGVWIGRDQTVYFTEIFLR